MEVIIAGACVSRVADVTDDFTLPRKLADYQAIGIPSKVSVVKDELLVGAELIDCRSTAFTLEKSYNFSVAGRHDRSSNWGHNIDCVMGTSFQAPIRKRVLQLFRPHSRHGNNELQCANETS